MLTLQLYNIVGGFSDTVYCMDILESFAAACLRSWMKMVFLPHFYLSPPRRRRNYATSYNTKTFDKTATWMCKYFYFCLFNRAMVYDKRTDGP